MSYINPKAEEQFFLRQKEMYRRFGGGKAPVVFDVGANIGQSIEAYRLLFPDAHITSFEPRLDCFETLHKKYGSQCGNELVNVALAAQPGRLPFYQTQCAPASSLLPPDEAVRKKSTLHNYDYQTITVAVDTIDCYCERKGVETIAILKIDVQGAELGVLKGAQKLLAGNRIGLLYLEVIFADNYQQQTNLLELSTFLATCNYLLWDIRPFLFTRSGRLWTANAIYVAEPTRCALEAWDEEFPADA